MDKQTARFEYWLIDELSATGADAERAPISGVLVTLKNGEVWHLQATLKHDPADPAE